jgi:hypothetical protein
VCQEGEFAACFPLNVSMVYSPKLTFVNNGNKLTNVRLALGETILEESSDEGDIASGGGGSSGFPNPRWCNVVTPIVPITTTPLPKITLALLTTPTIQLWTTAPQPGTRLIPEQ